MLHLSKSNSAEASLKIGHEGAALSRTRMPANAPESFVARFGVDRESRLLAAKLCTGRLFEIEPAIQKLLTGPNRDHNGQNRYGKKARPDRSSVRAGDKNHIRPRAALDP